MHLLGRTVQRIGNGIVCAVVLCVCGCAAPGHIGSPTPVVHDMASTSAGAASAVGDGVSSAAIDASRHGASVRHEAVDDRMFRGEQPTGAPAMQTLKALGVRTILALNETPDAVEAERTLASAADLDMVSIPISLERQPTEEEVLLFLGTVLAPERQPVYVHCEDGKTRTGAMVAMYRVVVGGWEIKDAYREAKEKGFWPYQGDAMLHQFIHQLKDHPNYFEWARELAGETVSMSDDASTPDDPHSASLNSPQTSQEGVSL